MSSVTDENDKTTVAQGDDDFIPADFLLLSICNLRCSLGNIVRELLVFVYANHKYIAPSKRATNKVLQMC